MTVDKHPYRRQHVELVDDDRNRVILREMDRVLQFIAPIILALPSASIGVAPANASYVTLSHTADLSAERVLTGTSNQVTVTDNGADLTVVLSLPQNINTTASVVFGSVESGTLILDGSVSGKLTITPAPNTTDYAIEMPPTIGTALTMLGNGGTPGTLVWGSIVSFGGAPKGENYVTIGNTGTLGAERALTGTSNQVVITDNGGNSTVVLSTPQNLHTATIFQVAQLGIGAAASSSPAVHLDVTGRTRFVTVVQSFSASQTNYDIGSSTVLRLTASNPALSIRGFTNGIDGRVVFIINDGTTNPFLLAHDTTATAANRFFNSTLQSIAVSPGSCKVAIYDGTISRWRVSDWMTPDGQYIVGGSFTWASTLIVDGDSSGLLQISQSSTPQFEFIDSATSNTHRLRVPSLGGARITDLQDFTGNLLVVGNDAPAVAAGALGKVDLTAQVANIATTNLSNAPPAGFYEVEVVLMCTTAAVGAGTLAVVVGWTDNVGATTNTVIAAFALTATGRTTGRALLRLASGEITYAVTVTGIYSTAAYAVYVRTIAKG